ncbi:MAG: hypothetical protein FWB96_01205 [Defluviitaleaceae bacterium]|nr:hypothetical protein [Defluviitaleaceae bacterium]MCL2261690.1 hypothetical protein [Defluviitaleaceae bacterium]
MSYTKNPYALTVQDNDVRESEALYTEIFPDAPPRVLGEHFSFAPTEQTTTRTVNIGGQTGRAYVKVVANGTQIVLTFQKGAEASIWKRRWFNQKKGQRLPRFSLKEEVSDVESPAIGKEITLYEQCTLIGYNDAPSSGSGTGTMHSSVTFHARETTLVQSFNPIQGVV